MDKFEFIKYYSQEIKWCLFLLLIILCVVYIGSGESI